MKQFRLFGLLTAPSLILSLFTTITHAAVVNGQGTWETTLLARDFDNDPITIEGYYDTVLGITWLADANYLLSSGQHFEGKVKWDAAIAWVASLDFGHGIDAWRLPKINPVNGVEYVVDERGYYDGTSDKGWNISAPGTAYAGSTGSELAHMYHNTLGNLSYYDTSGSSPQPGWGPTNTGPFDFSNIYPTSQRFWAASDYALASNLAWYFDMQSGGQFYEGKTTVKWVWPVHDGDVGTAIIPVPAAVWLFGSGLLGLIGISRRKKPA